jgi:hypothetical protein
MGAPAPLPLPVCADRAAGSQFLGRFGDMPRQTQHGSLANSEDLSGKAVQRVGAAAPFRAGKDGSGMKESNGG